MKIKTYQVREKTLFIVIARYNLASKELKKLNAREVTLAENAYARILLGENSGLSRSGNWVREDVLCIPQKGVFLTKTPATSESPEEATQAHRHLREFYLTKEQAEKALENAIQLPYDITAIPTNRFEDDERIRWMFEDFARKYGEALRGEGIEEMPIWLPDEGYVNEQSKPFARKLWFFDLGCRSGLCGDYTSLRSNHGRLFGIRE